LFRAAYRPELPRATVKPSGANFPQSHTSLHCSESDRREDIQKKSRGNVPFYKSGRSGPPATEQRTILLPQVYLDMIVPNHRLDLRTAAVAIDRPGRHATPFDVRSDFIFSSPHQFPARSTGPPEGDRIPRKTTFPASEEQEIENRHSVAIPSRPQFFRRVSGEWRSVEACTSLSAASPSPIVEVMIVR
jgi:hypothetical protein